MCPIQLLLKGPVYNLIPRFSSRGRKTVLSGGGGGGGGGERGGAGKRNQRKLATSVLLILDHTCFMYPASSILSSQSLMEN